MHIYLKGLENKLQATPMERMTNKNEDLKALSFPGKLIIKLSYTPVLV